MILGVRGFGDSIAKEKNSLFGEFWKLRLSSGHGGMPCATELKGTEGGQSSRGNFPDHQERIGLVRHDEDKQGFVWNLGNVLY